MKIDGNVAIIGGATVLILVAGWYMSNKAGKAAGAVVDTVKSVVPYVNPADSRNIAYSGVNAVGGLLAGDPYFDLGSWIYDVTHPAKAAPAPQDVYQIPKDFGIVDPGAGW